MKKILTLLTGIVFLITILAAGGCNKGPKQKVDPVADNDSTKVDIYLKAVSIDGNMHLEMYDSKKEGCVVIDGLVTVVYPGYTVTWKKAHESNINKVEDIRPIDDFGNIFDNLNKETDPESLWTLEIPGTAEPDTVKYEIDFTVMNDMDTTYTIDPYLRIPPSP